MTIPYRISRILIFIISSIASIYITNGDLVYATLMISTLFILFDLYWPRTDYS